VASTPPTPPSQQEQRANAEQDALLREVDEAVRQDQATDFARKHGTKVFGLVIVGLAAFGGWLWWSDQRENALETASEQVVLAMDPLYREARTQEERTIALQEAQEAFEPIIEAGGGAGIVAQLTSAGIAVEQGRTEDASEMYRQIAGNSEAPDLYRDFASIREVLLNYDDMEPADVEARMAPLAVPGAHWYGSAGELLGMAYLDQGKTAEAGSLFEAMSNDEAVPQSIRFRVAQIAGSMGIDTIDDPEETLGLISGER
jgi:hypothetical protein